MPVSAHVLWGKQRQNTVLAVGKSILDRTSTADIGALMLLPTAAAATPTPAPARCRHDDADRVVDELVGQLNAATRTPV